MTIKTILVTLVILIFISIMFVILRFLLSDKYKSNDNFNANGKKGIDVKNSNILDEYNYDPMDLRKPFYNINNATGVFSHHTSTKHHETISSSNNFDSTNPNNIF